MLKIMKIIRNIFFGIIFVIYLAIVICASTLVLNRNDYGYTQFGDKSFLDLREDVSKYTKGQLIVVGSKLVADFKVGDEVFVYRTNVEEQSVKIVNSTIKSVNTEDPKSSYITLDLDDSSWGQEYIAGQALKVYDKLGGVLSFVGSKWIFFVIFIVPCFFILLYEVYSVIVVIKFEGGDLALESIEGTDSDDDTDEANDISVLMAEINNLKSQLNSTNGVGSPGQSPQTNVVSPSGVTLPIPNQSQTVETTPSVVTTPISSQTQVVETSPSVVTTPISSQTQVVETSPSVVTTPIPSQTQVFETTPSVVTASIHNQNQQSMVTTEPFVEQLDTPVSSTMEGTQVVLNQDLQSSTNSSQSEDVELL